MDSRNNIGRLFVGLTGADLRAVATLTRIGKQPTDDETKNHRALCDILEKFWFPLPIEQRIELIRIMTSERLGYEQKISTITAIVPKEHLRLSIEFALNFSRLRQPYLFENSINNTLSRYSVPELLNPIFEVIDLEKAEGIKGILTECPGVHDVVISMIDNEEHSKLYRNFTKHRERESLLLAQILPETRGEVAAIIREKELTMQEKRQVLNGVFKNEKNSTQLLKACIEYMAAEKLEVEREEEQQKRKEAVKSLLQQFPDTTNILVLGESGSGKSTLINSIANYVKYVDIAEAEHSGVFLLIKKSLTYFRDGNQNNPVNVACPSFHGSDRNERTATGESSTLEAKCYEMQWEVGNLIKKLRLIDTPGLSDPQGILRDRKNMDSIIEQLENYGKLNAILIVLNSNETRTNTKFKYTVSEILSQLHISTLDNIMFCVTKSRTNEYLPGQTKATLTALLNDELKLASKLPIHLHNMYSYDNESLTYLCLHANNHECSSEEKSNSYISWEKGVHTTYRMLKRTSERIEHETEKSLGVSTARKLLNKIVLTITQMEQEIRLRKTAVSTATSQIGTYMKELEELTKDPQTIYVSKEKKTGRIDTVCSNQECTLVNELSNTVYKICHLNCNCVKIEPLRFNDQTIQRCECFNDITRDNVSCKHCNCGWSYHTQIDYEIVTNSERILYLTELLEHERNIQSHNDKRVAKLNEELEVVLHQTIPWIQHLNSDAIVPHNAFLKEMVEKELLTLNNQEETDVVKAKKEELTSLLNVDHNMETVFEKERLNKKALTHTEMQSLLLNMKGVIKSEKLKENLQDVDLLEFKNSSHINDVIIVQLSK